MRDVVRAACLAVCLVPFIAVAALMLGHQPDALEAAYQRAEVVRVCADGTYVGRDPVTGRYLFGMTSWDRTARGYLAPGVRPETVCAR